MATITVQINSDDQVNVSETAKPSGAVASAENAIDGGAPKIEGDTSSAAPSGGDQLDIGGPPQWLTDVLSKENKEEGNTSEEVSSETKVAANDGGAPKAM